MSRTLTAGAAFIDVFRASQSNCRRLLSSRLADRVLVDEGREVPRSWTGTIVAYPAPNGPFGDTVSLWDGRLRMRIVLDTSALKGERGVALVLDPGTYDIVRDNGPHMVIPREPPLIVPAFPQENGWYSLDERSGLPVFGTGKKRFLWRHSSEAVVAAAREHGHGGWARLDVFLNQKPSAKLASLLDSAPVRTEAANGAGAQA